MLLAIFSVLGDGEPTFDLVKFQRWIPELGRE